MKKLLFLNIFLTTSITLAASPANTLVIQLATDVPTLDPGAAYDMASINMVDNMYETLVTYEGASLTKLKPLLATKWKITNGGKVYTFDLRKNVKFHNGELFTCEDAEYSIRRNLVTNESTSGNWFVSESLLGTTENANKNEKITWNKIESAVKCNKSGQLVLTLPKVDSAFISKLAYGGQSILSKSYSVKLGEWDGEKSTWKEWVGKDLNGSKLSKKPNGTGPYRLIKMDANNLLFTAFDGYWGKKPNIKNVIRQKVPELAARQQAILKGDADIIEGGGRTIDTVQMKDKKGITWVDDLPSALTFGIFMNQNIKATNLIGSGKLDGKGIPADFFSDVNVRRAFSYAFDYDTYIKDVQKDKGKQLTMLLPESFPGYDSKVRKYSFDKKKATELFKQAWGGKLWEKGFNLTANYRSGRVSDQIAMEILKQNVEALNPKFKINIQAKQWSEMLASARIGEEAMALMGWLPDYADPDNFLYTFYASDGYYYPRTSFKDKKVDGWLKQARETVNTSERGRLYSQLGNRIYDLAPFINMPAEKAYLFHNSRLSGIGLNKATYNPMTSLLWKGLSKK